MTGIDWQRARRFAREAGVPLPAVEMPLDRATGATLAVPLVALSPLPAHDAAAMDGYAVAGPGPWRVVGRVLAGDPVPPPLPAGSAMEIGTGAVVPAGADAVLPYERSTRTGVALTGEFRPGRHIRRRGEDCPAGRQVLPAGTVVGPVVLGLAASLGHDTLAVHRRPRVGIVVTGGELCRSGIPAAGRVRDAIGPMLPGLIRGAGAEPVWESRVTDDRDAMVDALLRRDADVLVVCGATSAGAADHLRGALDRLAARVPIHGVACRPGHPQLFAVLPDGRFVVGLPGNPFAALVAASTLLTPLLEGLAGRPSKPSPTAVPAGPVTPHDHHTRLVPVTLVGATARPVGHDRPGSLWGAAGADALAVVPPGWTGGEVELLPLPAGTSPIGVTAPETDRPPAQVLGSPL
ncbi:molybdopterin-binding protein [Actinoplanes sichuanensis]|uniref:Molybdopterin molybdenumtransferase n=1 Tax=Actinoplanes sichuanensis TaxID=512349 RepID=A0ABW4A7E2_9ACTN|nr:molybdopterin molybdotransferase MoeA [Actinoplanes sichuanensis]BEL03578.1 molybdopterin-binding protein [Actinoplanes sichuanensis]